MRYVRGNVVPPVTCPNERWSIDFMHDQLVAGRTFRTVNVVDDFTRECVVLEVAFSFGSHDVIRFLEDAAFDRGRPRTIRFYNGSEFTSRAMLRWGAERDVNLHFIDPGKPTQNAQIESLNGRIRDEFFNVSGFVSIFEVRQRALTWKEDYNNVRLHSSLDYLTPLEFAAFSNSSDRHSYPRLEKPLHITGNAYGLVLGADKNGMFNETEYQTLLGSPEVTNVLIGGN